jgi:ParB family chromosome partitioning protein
VPSSTEDGGDSREHARAADGQRDAAAQGLAELRRIPVDQIITSRRPARRFLGDIAALAESMQDFGLQQPISVRTDGDRFILTSGLRRLAAAHMLRWETIPGFVRNVTADQAYVVDLIENLQRQDLSAEEEADALGELIRTRGWTMQQVAETIKRSVGYVSKRIRLFGDALLRDAVAHRGMPVSTAEELLAAAPETRAQLIERALAERWDQVRARDALRSSALDFEGQLEADAAVSTQRRARTTPAPGELRQSLRPQGFTSAIRAFHRLISELDAHDLTPSDRAALRALFRDLVFLARATPTRTPPVFPPLPGPTVRPPTRSRKIRPALRRSSAKSRTSPRTPS